MKEFLRKHLGKIAIGGLVIAAVGITVLTRSPQLLILVQSFIPELMVGTIDIIGSVVTIVGGGLFLGAGSLKVGYEMGRRDESAVLATEVEASQMQSLNQDQEGLNEAHEARDEVEAIQSEVNEIHTRLTQIESNQENFMEQDNERIAQQATREQEINRRLAELERGMPANAPTFFQPSGKGANVRRRAQKSKDDEIDQEISFANVNF